MTNIQKGMATDPLLSILGGSSSEINRDKLARILKPFVFLDPSTGELGFLPAFRNLKNLERLELVLAGTKARSLLIEGWADSTPPSDIINLEIMPPGSVKSGLKGLLEAHRIKKDKDAGYYLPNYRIDELDQATITHTK